VERSPFKTLVVALLVKTLFSFIELEMCYCAQKGLPIVPNLNDAIPHKPLQHIYLQFITLSLLPTWPMPSPPLGLPIKMFCAFNTCNPFYSMDVQEVGGGRADWKELAQDRDRWRALVSTVKNPRVA
jgi:hypothetical protein